MNGTRGRAERLLIISDTLAPDPNGVALIAKKTAELLAERSAVHLVGPGGGSYDGRIHFTGVRRWPVGTPDFRLPYASLGSMSRAVQESDRVIIHTLGPLGCAALYFAKRHKKHSTLFLHNEFAKLMRHTLSPGLTAGLAEWTARRVENWATQHASRVVAPESISADRFEVLKLDPPLFENRICPRPTDGKLTVVYHGRVSREKAVDATVKAIARVDPEHTRLKFKIIGAGSQLSPTLQLADGLGVPTEHIPWCPEPLPRLSEAQIYVMSSRTETYSMATLEAIGCGVPVIARRVGEIPTYVSHGYNGLLFESDDQLPSLLRTLADDAQLRSRLASHALAAATRKSVWEQFADAAYAGV